MSQGSLISEASGCSLDNFRDTDLEDKCQKARRKKIQRYPENEPCP